MRRRCEAKTNGGVLPGGTTGKKRQQKRSHSPHERLVLNDWLQEGSQTTQTPAATTRIPTLEAAKLSIHCRNPGAREKKPQADWSRLTKDLGATLEGKLPLMPTLSGAGFNFGKLQMAQPSGDPQGNFGPTKAKRPRKIQTLRGINSKYEATLTVPLMRALQGNFGA